MDIMSPEKQLRAENRKLTRELKRLKADNYALRLANEQAMRTQIYIQKDNAKQSFFTDQLLRTSPYVMILTDEKLRIVMTSDAFSRYDKTFSQDELRRGIPLLVALLGILPREHIVELMQKCQTALTRASVAPYTLRTEVSNQKTDIRISINRMMTKENKVAGLNIIFVDITDLVRATERAEAADKAKSNFLANMSHEIRTPMNSITGMAEFVLRDSNDPVAKRHAAKIKSASRTLLALINDILDFSKIESGNMTLVEDSYRLSSLLNDITSMIETRLHGSSVKLVTDLQGRIPDALFGDEIRIKQILINLLGNAVKFTSEGSITLSLRCEKASNTTCVLYFSVADTGIGLRETDMGRIFSSFTQVDMKRNRSVEGTGLGLAISKRLIEMMGGSLDVKSTYGEGSTFSFHILNTVENWDPIRNEKLSPKEITESAYRTTFYAPDAHILVVDDNEMNLDVAEGLLTPYRINVTRAQSGPEALKRFAAEGFDIVFMDHMMPGMDGVDTLFRLRKMKGGAETTVVALTANALAGAAAEYKEWGFQDFLAKPIDPQAMDKLLRKHLPAKKVHIIENGPEIPRAEVKGTGGAASGLPIDEAAALKYCMGSSAFLKKMLDAFAKSDKRAILEKFYKEKNWEQYRITVHALKGNALTIGALQLSDHAKALEFASRDKKISDVDALHPAFMDEYRELLEAIKTKKQ